MVQEAIADRGHGFDVARVADFVAKQAAELRDGARQRTVGNDDIAPHRIQQFFLRDQLLRIAQQEQEHAKCLRFDRQRPRQP